MHPVVIRSNITCKDQLSYFSSHWSDHMTNMSMGWLTDMKMMGREGDTLDSVAVHKAVILPLCPLLAIMERDVTKEDPTIILPDHPLELIQAFVHLIYKGSAPTSDIVTVKNLLELMAGLGLNMPAERLFLDRVERKEVEIVGFKNCYGLEIIEINHDFTQQVSAISHSSRKRSLEITPCPQDPGRSGRSDKRRRLNKNIKNLEVKKGKIFDKERKKLPELDVEVNKKDEDAFKGLLEREAVPIEVKLECEEYIEIEDTQPVKKRKWTRRSETLEKPAQSCEFCDFKCRFKKDLQEHCEEVHTEKNTFNCIKCPFNGLSFQSLKVHIGKKHKHGVPAVCGFGSERKVDFDRQMVKSSMTTATDILPQVDDQEIGTTVDGLEGEEYKNVMVKDVINKNVEESERSNGLGHNDLMLDQSLLVEKASDGKSMNPASIDENMNLRGDQELYGESVSVVTSSQENSLKVVHGNKTDLDKKESETNAVCKKYEAEVETKDKDKDSEIDSEHDQKGDVSKSSGELVGFKCGVPGCGKVSRVKYTTATYALNRLKTHHAKVHTELEDSQFQYVNVFKENFKIENSKVVDENPLEILKKVKASHKNTGRKTKPVAVMIKKGGHEDDVEAVV